MKFKFYTLVLCCCFALGSYAQSSEKIVFKAGKNGYASYRIPSIIKTPNGDLLAFAEGRKNGLADFGNNDIVLKRSKDNGQTWSELQIVVDYGKLQASNSAPVVDYTDPRYPNGRIFLFYNTGNVSETALRKSKGHRQIWYVTSIDNGETWRKPTNITAQVKLPDWRAYANTPGHAMQFLTGPYKSRIYIAANHSKGAPQADFTDYVAHGYYTDDHGENFHLSENISFKGSNEATAAPLANGVLIMNMRNQTGSSDYRLVARSADGGATWDTVFTDYALPDPVCQGSILNVGTASNPNILAFSNPADTTYRRNLTLRISYDGGKTWSENYLVDEKDAYTMYSDIVEVKPNHIGVLYEQEGYKEIAFRVIEWGKSNQ